MDEVGKFQRLLVQRDVSPCDQQGALLRLQRAHLFYPTAECLQHNVQVQHNFVTVGIAEGDFVDTQLHHATTVKGCSYLARLIRRVRGGF